MARNFYGNRKLAFLVLDCETATLPFANDIAKTPDEKKKIAIARPLIYDIGWTICHKNGQIVEQKQFLIAETFAVPSIFKTAYYMEKRPIYLEMLNKGEISCVPWGEVMKILIADLKKVDAIGAFNAMFDFKKAIPFTDLYISKLYSDHYFHWETAQLELCKKIIKEKYKKNDEREFDPDSFVFRGEEYPLFDIWGLTCQRLLNTVTYKKSCLKNGQITNSGEFFKTSAEAAYQFLHDKFDFIEAHTALADAEIETMILAKALRRKKLDIGIIYFPFKTLGTTFDFLTNGKNLPEEYFKTVIKKMEEKLDEFENLGKENGAYARSLWNKLNALRNLLAAED